MSPNTPGWLTARPIAHRGLHDAAAGVIENSIGAAQAAIAAGYAIECDVQATKDGRLVVFHDDTLERLTAASGRVCDVDAAFVAALTLRGSSGTIPLFGDFLAAIAGRTAPSSHDQTLRNQTVGSTSSVAASGPALRTRTRMQTSNGAAFA